MASKWICKISRYLSVDNCGSVNEMWINSEKFFKQNKLSTDIRENLMEDFYG